MSYWIAIYKSRTIWLCAAENCLNAYTIIYLDRLIILDKQPTLDIVSDSFVTYPLCVMCWINSAAKHPVCPPDTERICSKLSTGIVHRMSQGQAGPPLYILWPFEYYMTTWSLGGVRWYMFIFTAPFKLYIWNQKFCISVFDIDAA